MEFADLYAVLGASPEQGPAALRRAYRRYVARTHPDRSGRATDDGRLAEVNRAYARALAFQRQTGRLPGSTLPAPARPEAGGIAGNQVAAPPVPRPPRSMTAPARRSRWLGLAVVSTMAWLALLAALREPPPQQHPTEALATVSMQAGATGERFVTIGMEAQQVLSVQGQPTERRGDLWNYGPSWIRFHCGAVQAWNSSPLRPLQVRAASARDPQPASDCRVIAASGQLP